MAVGAGVAWGVVGVAFQDAPAAPPTAAAKTVAPVADNPSKIVHVAVSATETSGGGATATWSDDAWLGYPVGAGGLHGVAGFRQVLRQGGVTAQTGVFGRGLFSRTDYVHVPGTELYDPSTNTIYELRPVYYSAPFLTEPPAGGCRDTVAGGFMAGVPDAFVGGTKSWDRRLLANALAGGVYLGGPSAKPFFSGFNSLVPDLWSPCVSEQLAIQVHDDSAKRMGATSVDGRRVIEFRATDGAWAYYTDAHSHEPVRLVVKGIYGTDWPATTPPRRERATLTFDVRAYEMLPFCKRLLSLAAQHPGARIDTKTADYYAAQSRLLPRRSSG
jgi:hypothetical protein